MKKNTREPWVEPVFSLGNLFPWLWYQLGIRLFGIGVSEYLLLQRAIRTLWKFKGSFCLDGWDILLDNGEYREPYVVRKYQFKDRVVALKVCPGIAITFHILASRNHQLRPLIHEVQIVYLKERHELATKIALNTRHVVNKLRRKVVGRGDWGATLNYLPVWEEQLSVTIPGCEEVFIAIEEGIILNQGN